MPTPASEVLAKAILPTGLSSEEIRVQVPAEIRRRSFFSARTAEALAFVAVWIIVDHLSA